MGWASRFKGHEYEMMKVLDSIEIRVLSRSKIYSLANQGRKGGYNRSSKLKTLYHSSYT